MSKYGAVHRSTSRIQATASSRSWSATFGKKV